MRALLYLLAVATLASCNGVECGDGTFSLGDTCVGYDPDDKTPPVTTITPPGGRSRNPLPETVVLVSDEPATIYFTTDGSDPDPATTPGEPSPVTIVDITQGMTIRYLAIDRAGNRETIGSASFDSDTTPPAPVSNLSVTLSGGTAMVSWTNPTTADFQGTVFARVADVVDGVPTPGQLVTAPSNLSSSVQVLSVGTSEAFSDPGRAPGTVRYVAWTFDDVGNYSAPVLATASVPIGALTAQLAYDAGNNTLTVPQQPGSLELAGTPVLNGTTLTLTLSIKNNTTEYFPNPKLEITGTTNATYASSDGTADGFPFEQFGPGALAPGATVTRDLVFNNVSGTATIDVTFASHPSLLFTYGRRPAEPIPYDLGSGLALPPLVQTARGPNDRLGGQLRPGLVSGGRYLDVPTTHGAIERFDLVSGARVSGLTLEQGARANMQFLVDAGGDMIAMVKYGGRRDGARAELLRVDQSLRITQRYELPFGDDRGFARPALSADKKTLAIGLAAGILLVDVPSLTAIDLDPSTPGVDLISPGFSERIRSILFLGDTSNMFVAARTGGRTSVLTRSGSSYTAVVRQDTATTAKVFSAAHGPDGKIWIAMSSGLRTYDPATSTYATVAYAATPHALAVLDGQIWVGRSTRNHLDQISTTGAILRTITLPTQTGAWGHWLAAPR